MYVVSDTDSRSEGRLSSFEKENDKSWKIERIPRAREVGQSYLSSVFTTIWALIQSFFLVLARRPKLILCNGPGVCIPIVFSGILLRFFGFVCKIVFIESACRVEKLSLSGKVIYYLSLADVFFVQWEALIANAAPKAIYVGRTY